MGEKDSAGPKLNANRLKKLHEEVTSAKFGEKREPFPEEFAGPISKRKCRDVPMCCLFILFWVGMIVVGVMGFQLGNPSRLIYGTDMVGNVCGFDNTKNEYLATQNGSFPLDMKDKPFLFFGNPTDVTSLQVCVTSCPTSFPEFGNIDITLAPFQNLREDGLLFCPPDYTKDPVELLDVYIPTFNEDGVCFFAYPTMPILGRCVPSPADNTSALQSSLNETLRTNPDNTAVMAAVNGAKVMEQFLADINNAKWIILIGAGIALVLSFGWVMLLRYFAGFMVWMTIALILIVTTALSVILGLYAKESRDEYLADYDQGIATDSQRNNSTTLLVLAIICGTFTLMLWLAMLVMRSRINLAIAIIKEASDAMKEMPFLLVVPPIIFLFVAVFLAYWILAWLFLGTAGRPTFVDGEFTGYVDDKTVRGLQWYHLFGMFWTTQFFLGVGEVIIAGSVASYYFAYPNESGRKDVQNPVWQSTGRTLRYHLGSVAFGSLLIAIVKMIRVMIEYFEKQLKAYNNPVVNFLMKCLKCVFWCVEKFMKFITRNAYIMLSIYGESFCVSAKDSFMLLMRNALRLVAVNFIGDFLLFLGKVIITIITTVICFQLLVPNTKIVYYALPAIIIFVLAYAIASCFMQLYEMAIDTIFLAFCEDCERNDKEDESKSYMSKNLKEFMKKNEAKVSDLEKPKETAAAK